MEEKLDDLIVNLKVISMIKSNEKLVTTDKYLNIETINIVPQWIKRWHRGDNRDETIKKIDLIINECLNLDDSKISVLKTYLMNSISGLNKLKETYSKCIQTSSRIDTIIDKINNKINEEEYDDTNSEDSC